MLCLVAKTIQDRELAKKLLDLDTPRCKELATQLTKDVVILERLQKVFEQEITLAYGKDTNE